MRNLSCSCARRAIGAREIAKYPKSKAAGCYFTILLFREQDKYVLYTLYNNLSKLNADAREEALITDVTNAALHEQLRKNKTSQLSDLTITFKTDGIPNKKLKILLKRFSRRSNLELRLRGAEAPFSWFSFVSQEIYRKHQMANLIFFNDRSVHSLS